MQPFDTLQTSCAGLGAMPTSKKPLSISGRSCVICRRLQVRDSCPCYASPCGAHQIVCADAAVLANMQVQLANMQTQLANQATSMQAQQTQLANQMTNMQAQITNQLTLVEARLQTQLDYSKCTFVQSCAT